MPALKQLFESFSGFSVQSREITELFSNNKPKYDDDVMECLQFGICSTDKVSPKEVPYFHF